MKSIAHALIGAEDAGKVLGISARQVRNLIACGILPAQKVGRDYLIQRTDLKKVPRNRKRGRKSQDK